MKFWLLKKDLILLKRDPLIIVVSLLTLFIFLIFSSLKNTTYTLKIGCLGINKEMQNYCNNQFHSLNKKISFTELDSVSIIKKVGDNYYSAGIILSKDKYIIIKNSQNGNSVGLASALELVCYKYLAESKQESKKENSLKRIELKSLNGAGSGDSYSLIILIILTVIIPFNFAITFTSRELEDRTILLLIKSGIGNFELVFLKSALSVIASVICLIIMMPFLLYMKIITQNIFLIFLVAVVIMIVFSLFGAFVATIMGDLPLKPIISLILFITSTAVGIQFGAFPPEVKKMILYIPWINSLTYLYNAVNNIDLSWIMLIIYMPLYLLILYYSSKYWLKKSKN